MKQNIKKRLVITICFSCVLSGCFSKSDNNLSLKTKLVENDKINSGVMFVENTKSPVIPLEICDNLPEYSDKNNAWDLRNKDLSSFDLSNNNDLFHSIYDSNTIFPKKLPQGFDPIRLLEKGKNPGLGIRGLHKKGITGRGVNIAIIDQPLLLSHESIKDNIRLYELMNSESGIASMHGSAVTSIAAGKENGVAPDANIYYISSTPMKVKDGKPVPNNSIIIDGIKRVLEYNEILDESDKIKVITICIGFLKDSKNYQEIKETIDLAKEKGVFVITPSLEENYNIKLFGLDRDMNGNLDDYRSYTFAKAWRSHPFNQTQTNDVFLNIPMDNLTYAGFLSDHDYIFNSYGGLSWTCPWLTGMYALCLQVNPNLSGEEFLELALETGYTSTVTVNSEEYTLSKIINPIAIIEALENEN